MSSYVSSSGNLAGLPELRQSKNGKDYTRARVIQNFREQDHETGEWVDAATIAWDVIVTGRRARQLIEAALVNGNIGIQFQGRLHVRHYTRFDATTGTAFEVMADGWSILPGQNAMIAKPPAAAATT